MPETSLLSPVLPASVTASVAELFDTAVAQHRTAGITWAIIGGHAHQQAVLAHGAAGHRELRDGRPAEGSGPMGRARGSRTASLTKSVTAATILALRPAWPGGGRARVASGPLRRATLSRIASMTKSLSAATILALRDEGRLHLDEAVSTYVPEAAGAFELAADEREPTLRQLLTMSAGLVTDNPWGDRQEAMTREEFAATLRGGLGHVHRVGTGFASSNTSYALLGRVLDETTAGDYASEIRRRFLVPLGLGATGWSAEEIDSSHLATGHRLADRTDATRFEPVPLDAPG